MEIDLGTNIDASWTGFIAVRAGTGAAWTTISSVGLTVMPRVVSPLTVGANDPLRRNGKDRYMITLMGPNGYEIESFDIASITNQAGWTYNQAGLIQAVDDITTWIASNVVSITADLAPTDVASAGADHSRTVGLAAAVAIKASAGNLYGWNIVNVTATTKYVKFVDEVVGSTVVGTTPVVTTLRIPGNSMIYQEANSVQYVFGTAITVYAVTAAGDAAAVAVPANTLIVDFKYK